MSGKLAEALRNLFARLEAEGRRVAVARGAWVRHAVPSAEEGAGWDAARRAEQPLGSQR